MRRTRTKRAGRNSKNLQALVVGIKRLWSDKTLNRISTILAILAQLKKLM